MLVPGRRGVAHYGLLDFQDALVGHPAYDLASVLEDARRDVTPAVEAAMLDRYVAATGQGELFRTAYWVLAAQRNTRILRSEEHTSELQSLMRISYAVFCLQKTTYNK